MEEVSKVVGRAPLGQALVASDEAPAGLHPSGFDPSRKLTRSARAERNRIVGIYKKAVSETCQAILLSGWNKLTPHQRRKNKSVAEAFDLATACLARALEETRPDPGKHITREEE